ncbi:cellulose biosynthesis protein BcsS [Phreatobacter aquaticus]|nr:cellulose biosynthesis protein BcsS [Phreatobacter aquaticus]
MRLWLASSCILWVCAGCGALADEVEKPPAPTALAYAEFGGTFDGAHVSSGVDFTLGQPIDARGLIVRIGGNTGWSRFQIDPAIAFKVSEVSQSGRLMLGWRETGSWGTVTAFAGVGIESRRLIPNLIDPQTGTRAGPAFAIDAWLTPFDRVAVQAYLGTTTAFGAWTLKIAPGYRVAANVHVGPEITWSRHHGSERLRVGGHVTGLQVFAYGIRLSGGYAQDRGGRGGAYAALSLWHRY